MFLTDEFDAEVERIARRLAAGPTRAFGVAKGLLNLSDRPEVRSMAQHVVDTQSSEIALMTDMLEKRGARPYASILGGNA